MTKIGNAIRLARFLVYRIFFSRGAIKFGADNVVGQGFDWEVQQGRLGIGNKNYFNKNVKIVCFESITIGDDCMIADSMHIYDHDHRFDDLNRPIRAGLCEETH